MASYRILSLDGGGSRGVVTACLVGALAKEVPGFLDRVDLFAGSSIGAANAFSLALPGRDAQGMVAFYRDYGPTLFSSRYRPGGLLGALVSVLEAVPGVDRVVEDATALFYPKWSNEGLRRALAIHFGTRTMRNFGTARVLAPTLKLSDHPSGGPGSVVEPVLMTNFPDSEYLDSLLTTILLRSMSAPGYFESSPDGFVDGGVFLSNPAPAALATARERAGRPLSEVRLLSIGTGRARDGIETKGPLAWGALEWGQRFAGVSVDAVGDFGDQQCGAMLGGSYCRLDPTLPRPYAMDEYQAIPELIEIAENATRSAAFATAVAWLEDHFMSESERDRPEA
jgi:patatin-like phospholipase/acyl hydrolase